jgi:hypothetical protein
LLDELEDKYYKVEELPEQKSNSFDDLLVEYQKLFSPSPEE